MTNRIALGLAALIALAFVADHFGNSDLASLFLLRKLADLLEWVAFWR